MRAHGKTERWFRYPYLETGKTITDRQRFEAWLARRGYRVAPVSMENSDWKFAEPYDDAIEHHRWAKASQIRTAYLRYTAQVLPWYLTTARQLLGREPAFVMLLHARRLNAVSINALAETFARMKLRPVPLAQAMADPAYERYIGLSGAGWVQRWAGALHRPYLAARMPRVPAEIETLYARVDAQVPDLRAPAR